MKTRHDACAFFDREELIDGDIWKSLPLAAGPTNLHLRALGFAQSKMQPEIIAGQKARLTLYFLRLSRARSFDDYAPANGTAIGLGADQPNLEPGIAACNVVSKQRRRLV